MPVAHDAPAAVAALGAEACPTCGAVGPLCQTPPLSAGMQKRGEYYYPLALWAPSSLEVHRLWGQRHSVPVLPDGSGTGPLPDDMRLWWNVVGQTQKAAAAMATRIAKGKGPVPDAKLQRKRKARELDAPPQPPVGPPPEAKPLEAPVAAPPGPRTVRIRMRPRATAPLRWPVLILTHGIDQADTAAARGASAASPARRSATAPSGRTACARATPGT